MASIADPVRIGSVLVPNRFVGAPTVMQNVDPDGNLTPAGIEIYRERAKGGVGLVVVEATAVERGGVIIGEPHPTLEREDQVPVMALVARAIHDGGAKAFLQLVHAGRMSQSPVAPSMQLFYGIEPRVLTTEDCHVIVRLFVRAARFARAAGFDGVHLHAGHGWLLHQFLSPYTNRRDDEYGDRRLFLTRTIEGVREACGVDFAIAVRVSADEYIGEKGITLDWTREVLVPAIERAGCDAIDVSAATLEPFRMHYFVPPLYQPRGVIIPLAQAVKEVAHVPVVGVGRINHPALARKLIEEGKADLIGLSRGLLADPDFVRKALEGRDEEVRLCAACDHCAPKSEPARCAVNPFLGKGGPPRVAGKARKNRKLVLVAGGGPAGLEAATVAASAGHRVVLCEKAERLGGLLWLASHIPRVFTRELFNAVDWLEAEIRRLKVEVRLGTEVDEDVVRSIAPEAAILATGSIAAIPPRLAPLADRVFTVDQCLEGERVKLGARVAIQGFVYGAELAVSLAKRGHQVTLFSRESVPMLEGRPFLSVPYMARPRSFMLGTFLTAAGVEVLGGAKIVEAAPGALVLSLEGHGNGGEAGTPTRTLPVDSVVAAGERRPDRRLREVLRRVSPEVHEAGDCVEPRSLLHAIHEGAAAALRLGTADSSAERS